MLDRTIAPDFAPIQDFALLKPEILKLANGLPLFVISTPEQPTACIQLIFKAGRWYEAQAGDAYFISKLLFEGTKDKSAQQIHEILEGLGVFWEITPSSDTLTIDINLLRQHLKAVCELLKEVLTEASMPQTELDTAKEMHLQQVQINKDKNNIQAFLKFRELIFGESHPYGYHLDEQKTSDYQIHNAIEFYQQNMIGKPFDIFLSGNVGDEEIAIVAASLGKLAISKEPIQAPKHPDITSQPAKIYLERPNAMQTSLRIGKLLKINKEEKIVFGVLNEILGGFFGSRLMKNIREDKGFTYGIHSGLITNQHADFLSISSDVKKENYQEALKEIYHEMNKLCSEPVGEEELELVKNYMAGEYIKTISSHIALADYAKSVHYHQLEADYFDTYVSKIRAVTAEQIQDFANKFFNGGFVEVAVG